MEESNLVFLSPDSIKNILTLRYNPEIQPILPKLTSEDFTTTNNESSTEFMASSTASSAYSASSTTSLE